MKKTLLILSLFVTTAIQTVQAAGPDPTSEEAKASFKKEFPGAEIINWSSAGDLLKAVFIYDGYRSEAYFTEEGELKGSARNIFYAQLPLAVTRAIEKRYEKPDVMEVTEITMGSGTSYVIRLSSGTRSFKLQVDAGGNLIQKEKIRS